VKKSEITIKLFEVGETRILEVYREGERIDFPDLSESEISVLIEVVGRKRGELPSEQ
jgi:hypothetical protein